MDNNIGLDKEYIKIVEDAANNNENLDISNSTLEHAVFLSQKLISKSENNINILTGELGSVYYDRVKGDLEEAAKRFQPQGKKIRVIMLNNSTHDDLNNLIEKFKGVFEVRNATTPSDREVHHFFVSDSKRYRFENPHTQQDLIDQQVSAIANFNNINVASILNGEFNRLWESLS